MATTKSKREVKIPTTRSVGLPAEVTAGSPSSGTLISPFEAVSANLLRRRTEASALRIKRRQSRRGPTQTPSAEAFENLQRKRSITKYGNLFLDTSNSDRWIPGLIPEDLIQELYDETNPIETSPDEGSSVEVTESGTVVRKIRRGGSRDGDSSSVMEFPPGKSLQRLESPDDIHGWKARSRRKISKWSEKNLTKHMALIERQLERQKTANSIHDRVYFRIQEGLNKMQANIDPFSFRLIGEREKKYRSYKLNETVGNTCGPKMPPDDYDQNNEGEEEEIEVDELGRPIYEGFDPIKDFNREDPIYQNLTPPQKKELEELIHANGNFVTNFNFDVMRHKYPDIDTQFERDMSSDKPEHEEFAEDRKVLKRTIGTIIKDGKPVPGIEPESVAIVDIRNPLTLDIGIELPGLLDDDSKPTFVGTHLIGAKRLPILTKADLAVDEIKLFLEELFDYKITNMKEELSVQVHLDGFVTAMNIIHSATETIKNSLTKSVHPLSGRVLAEGIILFRKHLENVYMADFTKYTIAVSEFMKKRNIVEEQISDKRLLGNDYELIDFEFMEIENTGLTAQISEELADLKKLKVHVGNIYEELKQHRAKLQRQMAQLRTVDDSIAVRKQLQNTLEETGKHSAEETYRLGGYNSFMANRLRKFEAPEPMEYIRDKAAILELETERDKLTIKRNKSKATCDELTEIDKKLTHIVPTLKPGKEWISPLDHPASDPNFAFRSSKESMKTLKAWGRSVGLIPLSRKSEIIRKSKSTIPIPDVTSQKIIFSRPSDKKLFVRPQKVSEVKVKSAKSLSRNRVPIITKASSTKISASQKKVAIPVPAPTNRYLAPATGRMTVTRVAPPSTGGLTRSETRASATDARRPISTTLGQRKPGQTFDDIPKVLVPTTKDVALMNKNMSTHPHHIAFQHAMIASRHHASKASLVPVPLALQMAERTIAFKAVTTIAPRTPKQTPLVRPQRRTSLAAVKIKAMANDRKGGNIHTDY